MSAQIRIGTGVRLLPEKNDEIEEDGIRILPVGITLPARFDRFGAGSEQLDNPDDPE